MDRRHLVVALVSATILSLEILWTRIFSAELYYTFAFLILSLAILGLGLGALALRLVPRLGAAERRGPLLAVATLLALVAPPAVLRLGLDFSKLPGSLAMLGLLVATLVLLAAPLFFAGVVLAVYFREGGGEMRRLYMADLLGAGFGAGAAVLLMNAVGTPLAALLVLLPMAFASFVGIRRPGPLHVVLVLLLGAAFLVPRELLDVPRPERAPIVGEHWDSQAKIKITNPEPEALNINIDNLANTGAYRFDGNLEKARREPPDFLFHFSPLVKGKGRWSLAVIGAGGGSEVLQGLVEGASEIHAIEVIGAINRMLTTGELATFTGRIYQRPEVRVATADARAYLRRYRGKFDVIVSSSSNTFAALSSGAFALSENTLFTTEAFADFWDALAPHGFLVMEHQFYIPRAVGSVRDALLGLGVAEPQKHVAIYDLPKMRRKVLLLSKAPLTEGPIRGLFGKALDEKPDEIRLLSPVPPGKKGELVARILERGWRAEADLAPIDLSPATDDRPFIAQMGLWRNLDPRKPIEPRRFEFDGYPLSKLLLSTILAVVLLLATPLLLLPRLRGGDSLRLAPAAYFFAIGVAFMAVEVVLIQQLTLFLGSSASSTAVILVTLLLSCGAGSRRAHDLRHWVPFAGIVAALVVDILLFSRLATLFGAAPLAARYALAVLAIAPLGFFMGMPFVKGAREVGELVDWGFAVNGVASVVGGTGVLFVSMAYGFRAALALAGLVYLVAGLLLLAERLWEPGTNARPEPPVEPKTD